MYFGKKFQEEMAREFPCHFHPSDMNSCTTVVVRVHGRSGIHASSRKTYTGKYVKDKILHSLPFMIMDFT